VRAPVGQNRAFAAKVQESGTLRGGIVNHVTRELVIFGVPLALVVAAIYWRYRHPQLYAANVVAPGNRFNRIQHTGLSFMLVGVVSAVGISILLHFHPLDPSYHVGSLSESKTFILVGAVTFLIGWNRRRKVDGPPQKNPTGSQ